MSQTRREIFDKMLHHNGYTCTQSSQVVLIKAIASIHFVVRVFLMSTCDPSCAVNFTSFQR